MTLAQPTSIMFETAILFLGSGFSAGARNIENTELPTGGGLKDRFAAILGVDPRDHDLKALADEIHSRPDLDLYQILYKYFTVQTLTADQEDVLKWNWLRVYTTNYDDLVELHRHKCKSPTNSFSYDDEKPAKLPHGSVIHLHGVIRKATEDNVLDQLVLNDASYVRQHFERSDWYDDFARDLRHCSAAYFLGYSLSDYHIAALLMQSPTLKQKTYFVTRSVPDKIFARRVEPYGGIMPIGVAGFSTLCSTLPKEVPSKNLNALKSYRFLDPFIDKKTTASPTPVEVQNLITFGAFNFQRCLSTFPICSYVVPRLDKVEQAVRDLNNHRCLLVHSRIGNGKTVFLYMLAIKLAEVGFKCVMAKPDPMSLRQDFDVLATAGKVAVLFDSYNAAVSAMEVLRDLPDEVKFVVAVRTGVQEVRLHEIQARLPKPVSSLSLNGLTDTERSDFSDLVDKSGSGIANLKSRVSACRDFRELVLLQLSSEIIRKKLDDALAPVLKDRSATKVFAISHILKWGGHEVGAGFLKSVTQRDAALELGKHREIAIDIFNLEDDDVRVRSSIVSEHLLGRTFDLDVIVDAIESILLEAVQRKRERRYQAILSNLMAASNLRHLLSNKPGFKGSIERLFARLSRDVHINAEPLFWLQYSIVMLEANDLPVAERFLKTAYLRAADEPAFKTFQLDTHALKLLLILECAEPSASPIGRFSDIVDKSELVTSMIGDESHRDHAVRALEGFEEFVSRRKSGMSIQNRNVLVFLLNRLIGNLDGLTLSARAMSGSDGVKLSLERAKNAVLV
jgi:SIR2-like domain